MKSSRIAVLILLAISCGLLIPGLAEPVLTIRGVLQPEGVAKIAPQMLEKGLSDDTVKTLQSMMNPAVVSLLQASGGDLRKTIIEKLTPEVVASLKHNTGEVEVFQQTRSIAGSVRHLYQVGSLLPATLILLFSVIVPFCKIALVLCATFTTHPARRQRTLNFVELIAKWSMADVFVVALFIAYLAARSSQSSPDNPSSSLVAFTASFGAGFYWFAGYCLFSLASQQLAARWLLKGSAAAA